MRFILLIGVLRSYFFGVLSGDLFLAGVFYFGVIFFIVFDCGNFVEFFP